MYAKFRNQRLIYQEKSFAHKKIISNCLANGHRIYDYNVEIQHIELYVLSLVKRQTGRNRKPNRVGAI